MEIEKTCIKDACLILFGIRFVLDLSLKTGKPRTKMKSLIVLLGFFFVTVSARYQDFFNPDDDDFLFGDPQSGGNCPFQCNNVANSGNRCVDGECACVKGFAGQYCTCDGLCRDPFGSCDNDAAGTCSCTSNWKGRNCNCPVTCPDSSNWGCKTGHTVAQRGCFCREDGQGWFLGKKCCPKACSDAGMSCLKDDGVCYCSYSNTYIPYGSANDAYRCCHNWCKGSLCQCRSDGCIVKTTGMSATRPEHCQAPQPASCRTPGSWQECSIVHWQGRCVCNPQDPSDCRCKCWYGWAGGSGVYMTPGWESGSPGVRALYADHCRNRCDWTHHSRPDYCSRCQEVDCPECIPKGSKKCAGTS